MIKRLRIVALVSVLVVALFASSLNLTGAQETKVLRPSQVRDWTQTARLPEHF